ncbi:DUF881 domain-containing protein [Nocardioidaceae bacterium]|nr:DUF881 domain-containing protein [Nocardioidaceae bacterium]
MSAHDPSEGASGPSGPPRSRGRQLVVAVLLGALGLAAATQITSRSDEAAYTDARTDELVSLLAGQAAARERLETEIAELERDREALSNSFDSRAAALRRSREEAYRLGVLAGTVPAVGPGVRVSVEDAEGAVGINQLLNAVQELRDSGAEVIEVDQRIRLVASSWFEDDPEGVVVDGQLVRPPYVLEAIGEPGTLAGGLDFTGGFIDDVLARGGTVDVEQLGEVRVDAVVD